jgi:hypothetical protein
MEDPLEGATLMAPGGDPLDGAVRMSGVPTGEPSDEPNITPPSLGSQFIDALNPVKFAGEVGKYGLIGAGVNLSQRRR